MPEKKKIEKSQKKVQKPRKKVVKDSKVKVDFKKVTEEVIKIIFTKPEVLKQIDHFKQLEEVFKDGRYYEEGRKLYDGKGYARVMETF